MDAREYLNRKGVGVERESDRPNTLEEKSWERARGAGEQRPKSGTPHDWEDWERYHDELAKDASELEQKIDKQAHRKETLEATPAEQAHVAVEHFTPPKPSSAPHPHVANPDAQVVRPDITLSEPHSSADQPSARRADSEPGALKAAYLALAVLLPPLALGLTGAGGTRLLIGIVLTLLGWLPGVIYALVWLQRR
ncbi:MULTISPECIES: YqaE/Pmp3 family membrane protein [Halomonas]|uniref:YqaE/Pmp3 family membrane protein n=1 Tax=Halomonas TaxID=2745 RepID=UPI000EEF9A76|nr:MULTISPECIES: YqaE/Pmp3 family membrane protein [Halomonas]HCR98106.1 YqaE/Pmp3 family membrane protein [Halomonas sp.]